MSFSGDDRPLVSWGNANSSGLVTQFREQLFTQRVADIYLSPSWGISTLRDSVIVANGGTVAFSEGEIQVAVPGAVNGFAEIESLARALYIPGAQGQFGMGVRIPTPPVNDQAARWGLFGGSNGFGFGVDATGYFLFYRTNGDPPVIFRPDDWLFGLPEGFVLNAAAGLIWHIDFTWYGYGTIVWSILVQGPDNVGQAWPLHAYTPNGQLSVRDPGQPLRAEVENGASGGAFEIRLGGRQFAVLTDKVRTIQRNFSEPLYSLGPLPANPAWTAALSFRRKEFLADGQPNSIRAFYKGFEALIGSTDSIEFRATFGGSVDGGAWSAPADVSPSETGIEINSTFTSVTAVGEVFDRGLAPATSRTSNTTIEGESSLELGGGLEVILWARPLSGTPTIPALLVNWTELW